MVQVGINACFSLSWNSNLPKRHGNVPLCYNIYVVFQLNKWYNLLLMLPFYFQGNLPKGPGNISWNFVNEQAPDHLISIVIFSILKLKISKIKIPFLPHLTIFSSL